MTDSPNKVLIQVLDDNPFYAKFLERQVQLYIDQNFPEQSSAIGITSFTDHKEFLAAIPESGSIAVIDYYLGDGVVALDLLKDIREKSAHCRVIIMTTENNLEALAEVLDTNVAGFVFKDEKTILLMHPIIEKEILTKLETT